jgi:hypothetical protein
MMKRVFCALAVLMMALLPKTAAAAPIDLFQWIFNVDGTLYDSTGLLGSSTLPASFSGTPAATGAQGLITVTLTGAGAHSLTAFWDYELNEVDNGFTNESASVTGVPGAGLGWEVDEPGFVFGDIYGNVQAGTLDNTNAVPAGNPDDVSVAFDWNFFLNAGETAVISLVVSETAPGGGFFISHFDAGTQTDLFYSTSLDIQGGTGPPVIPEPASLLLLGSGLTALGSRKYRAYRARRAAERS